MLDLVHAQVRAMVAAMPVGRWRMDASAIREAQTVAVDWETTHKREYGREGFVLFQPPSPSHTSIIEALGAAGPRVKVFIDRVSNPDAVAWTKVMRAAQLYSGWQNEKAHRIAGTYVEQHPATHAAGAMIAMAAGASIARAGLGPDENQILTFAAGTAGLALIAHDVLDSEAVRSMYGPFADVIPGNELDVDVQ